MGICRRLLSTTSSETAILCARCFGITQGGQCATKEHQDTQYQHHPPPDSEQFLILSGPLIISASGRPRAPPVSSLRGSIGSGQGRKPTLLYAPIQLLSYQMVRALCRFDINLVQTMAPGWRQIVSEVALDLITIPVVSALVWGGRHRARRRVSNSRVLVPFAVTFSRLVPCGGRGAEEAARTRHLGQWPV